VELGKHCQQRGRDSSGLLAYRDGAYTIWRAAKPLMTLRREIGFTTAPFVMGHSRLVTNGMADNQPIVRDGVCVIHNGIVVNDESLWKQLRKPRELEVDTEVIAAIAAQGLEDGVPPEGLAALILEQCQGTVAAAMAIPGLGKLCLFSNNGSLYLGSRGGTTFFASEAFPLTTLGCTDIQQIKDGVVLDIPQSASILERTDTQSPQRNLVPVLGSSTTEERLLTYEDPHLRRCTRCVLPETMPFITFDTNGLCNFCIHYRPRMTRSEGDLRLIADRYRRPQGPECIVPFSGGRDSSYALHVAVNELELRPIAYTYDWGMVTDLGRRNISRMCAELGVENIVIAADIAKKRENIRKNLTAWLKAPHLGLLSLLTAGDKHFFQHIDTVKRQTGVSLNLWGINPLETTHFKAGFLGVRPDFEETGVYSRGLPKQARYQALRFGAMARTPSYFNSSLWDTLSGEYYRSFMPKTDYFHVFDYYPWDEHVVESALAKYAWETAPDTQTTWRIGDGTAAFYNYVYYTAAGFTEHDTFRSNQIREGLLSREEALRLITEENQPRYPNIKWYLDAIGMDFTQVISVVNAMPREWHSRA
jgi:hypothetical protein